jgi:hypothetical protein
MISGQTTRLSIRNRIGRSTNDPNLLSRLDLEADVFEDIGETGSVGHRDAEEVGKEGANDFSCSVAVSEMLRMRAHFSNLMAPIRGHPLGRVVSGISAGASTSR